MISRLWFQCAFQLRRKPVIVSSRSCFYLLLLRLLCALCFQFLYFESDVSWTCYLGTVLIPIDVSVCSVDQGSADCWVIICAVRAPISHQETAVWSLKKINVRSVSIDFRIFNDLSITFPFVISPFVCMISRKSFLVFKSTHRSNLRVACHAENFDYGLDKKEVRTALICRCKKLRGLLFAICILICRQRSNVGWSTLQGRHPWAEKIARCPL